MPLKESEKGLTLEFIRLPNLGMDMGMGMGMGMEHIEFFCSNIEFSVCARVSRGL